MREEDLEARFPSFPSGIGIRVWKETQVSWCLSIALPFPASAHPLDTLLAGWLATGLCDRNACGPAHVSVNSAAVGV